uniref:Uncharacterized protein n=1 Tax=Tanacetum cinerariifolium TaxID=118510 RepID=A0A6L2JJ40_TANCI|nr:hypothetical protein [Tanacetum cinerariifolium]
MDLLHTLLETCITLTRKVEALEQDKVAQAFEIIKLKQRVKKVEKKNRLKVSRLRRLKKVETSQRIESSTDNDDKLVPVKLKEVVDIVTTAKLMTKVVTAAAATITAATTRITATTITVAHSSARRRKGVVIRDIEETATPSIIIHSDPNSKDKGKGIMVQEPKPLKKKTQIE